MLGSRPYLCKRYERNVKAPEANGDDEDSVQAMSKSEKCKMSRQTNTLNHNMGQTSFDSYRYDHENLHKAHSDAINSGSDENTANDKALEQVFSRTTLLKSHGARGSKIKTPSSKFSVGPTQEQFDAMKKGLEDRLKESKDKQIESDSKVAYLTGALNTVMSILEGHGLLDASVITRPERGTSGPSDDSSMD